MIVVPALLGLFEVFIFWQLDLFGATVVAFLGFLFAFRYDAQIAELVLAAAVYSFVVSIFVRPLEGVLEMFAVISASLLTVAVYRVLVDSRLKKMTKKLSFLFFSVVFNGIYFGLIGLRFMNDYGADQQIGMLILTMFVSCVLLVGIDLVPLKRREETLK